MKRIFAVLLAVCMLAALTACGGTAVPDSAASQPQEASGAASGRSDAPETADESPAETPSGAADDGSSEAVSETSSEASDGTDGAQEDPASSEAEPAADAHRSLVVYFSWSGNTRKVAESIQRQTGSDLFEIVPKTPYSSDYNTVVDDAKAEQQNDARPEIDGAIENLGDYDTVYVGFPNWWGDMPMILYTFFDTYDLSGKTVALFCTSGGSGLSNTVAEVKELEPDAQVTEGLHIGSSASADPDDAVAAWLEKLGTVQG